MHRFIAVPVFLQYTYMYIYILHVCKYNYYCLIFKRFRALFIIRIFFGSIFFDMPYSTFYITSYEFFYEFLITIFCYIIILNTIQGNIVKQ